MRSNTLSWWFSFRPLAPPMLATSLGFWRNHLLQSLGPGTKSFLSLVVFLCQVPSRWRSFVAVGIEGASHCIFLSTNSESVFVDWVADYLWMMRWVLPRGLDFFTLFSGVQRLGAWWKERQTWQTADRIREGETTLYQVTQPFTHFTQLSVMGQNISALLLSPHEEIEANAYKGTHIVIRF